MNGALGNNQSFNNLWQGWLSLSEKEITTKVDVLQSGRRPLLEILIQCINKIQKKNIKILEIGCGTGVTSMTLAMKTDAIVTACDLSGESLKVARYIQETIKCPQISFLQADTMALPFDDRSFDIVFSQGVMEHFPSPLPGLREQARILAPSGILVVDVPQKINPYALYKRVRIKKQIWPYGWETDFTKFDLRKWEQHLGLDLQQIKGYGYGFKEDYGFSALRFLGYRLKSQKKWPILQPIGDLIDIVHLPIEKRWGHLFMQNIVGVFQKLK